MLVRDRLEVDLRQRLAKAEAKVSAAEKEGQELRQVRCGMTRASIFTIAVRTPSHYCPIPC